MAFQTLIEFKMKLFLISIAFLTILPFTTMTMFPCLLVETTPINEVEQLEITSLQLECVSGCSLLSVSSVTCNSLKEDEEQVAMSTIQLSDRPYLCHTSSQLPPTLELHLHSLDCQFCDSLGQLLVQDSCSIKYSLTRVDIMGWYDIGVGIGLLTTLVILLIMLYREVLEVIVVDEENGMPVGRGDTVISGEQGGRGERGREEEMFQQGHSLLGRKRRGRSRSKRRVKERE